MITNLDIAGFVALAGEDFSWAGVVGCSRPSSAGHYRRNLRDWLWTAQGEVCAVCGNGNNGDAIEFNHVVARGPQVRGFVAGNVFAGHGACNARTKPVYDESGNLISGVEVLWTDSLARPDVIPTAWPKPPTLKTK